MGDYSWHLQFKFKAKQANFSTNDSIQKQTKKRSKLILCYINFQGSIQFGTRLSFLFLLFRIWQIFDLLCGMKILLVETSLVKLRFHSQALCQVKPITAIVSKNRRNFFFFCLFFFSILYMITITIIRQRNLCK